MPPEGRVDVAGPPGATPPPELSQPVTSTATSTATTMATGTVTRISGAPVRAGRPRMPGVQWVLTLLTVLGRIMDAMGSTFADRLADRDQPAVILDGGLASELERRG